MMPPNEQEQHIPGSNPQFQPSNANFLDEITSVLEGFPSNVHPGVIHDDLAMQFVSSMNSTRKCPRCSFNPH